MTTVLPLPVAILKAMRGNWLAGSSPALACRCRNWFWICVPVFDFSATSLNQMAASTAFLLREKQFLMRGPFGVGEPVVEQIASDAAGDPAITRLPPGAQLVPEPIDQVFTVFCPEVVNVEHAALVLLADRYLRHVRGKDAAAGADVPIVQVALRIGGVVPRRLVVGGVQDGVVGGGHGR
jgi:hypothetical protein